MTMLTIIIHGNSDINIDDNIDDDIVILKWFQREYKHEFNIKNSMLDIIDIRYNDNNNTRF